MSDIEIIPEPEDNLNAAMKQVADTIKPGRTPHTGIDPGQKAVQILIRAPEETRDRWKQAADLCGISTTEFVRRIVDERVNELLDCTHPPEYRKRYPWSETCTRCGTRLRG